ncbi:hypothetical protein [Prescottella sp. R16]|uniref:hypothetical protein n=1 Tax=Prescottella sp. R16 TaxID=3064529 RepID=UPI00272DF166|nr:hypothetical protein [Prescottella sp. R16]
MGDFRSSVANTFSPKLDPAETVDYFLTGPYSLADGNTQIAGLAVKASSPILPQEKRTPLYNQICNQTNATVSTAKVTGTEDMPWMNLGIFDLRHVDMTK